MEVVGRQCWALQSAVARVRREGGASVSSEVFVRDGDLDLGQDAGRLDADGRSVETTMSSLLHTVPHSTRPEAHACCALSCQRTCSSLGARCRGDAQNLFISSVCSRAQEIGFAQGRSVIHTSTPVARRVLQHVRSVSFCWNSALDMAPTNPPGTGGLPVLRSNSESQQLLFLTSHLSPQARRSRKLVPN